MKHLTCIVVAFATLTIGGVAHAERVRAARENIAGGVTAGAAENVTGPRGGRVAREGGVVTNGEGGGVAGARGCGRDWAGAEGCRAGATAWDRNGNVAHESSSVVRGPGGGYGSASGSFTRDADGDLNGSRQGEYHVGDRSYSAQTTVQSGQGVSRSVECEGSGCR